MNQALLCPSPAAEPYLVSSFCYTVCGPIANSNVGVIEPDMMESANDSQEEEES